MKFNSKKMAKIIGNALVLISLIFIVRRLLYMEIDYAILLQPYILIILGVATFFLTFTNFLGAHGWRGILEFLLGKKIAFVDASMVYTKANLAKYLPGNFMHYVGRNAYGKSLGLTQPQLALSSIIEIAAIIVTHLILSSILSWNLLTSILENYIHSFNLSIVFPVLFIVIILFTILLLLLIFKKPQYIENVKRLFTFNFLKLIVLLFFVYAIITLGTGCVLFSIISLSIPVDSSKIFIILAASVIANVIGLLVIGAPGGIGVREAVLLFLLKDVCPADTLLIAVILQRLVAVLGDLAAYMCSMFMFAFFKKRNSIL